MLVRLPLYEGVDWNNFATRRKGCGSTSPSLRGSGLKFILYGKLSDSMCLPLYEGVDWNFNENVFPAATPVSLFTREWIEIIASEMVSLISVTVSLFTREWIEIDSQRLTFFSLLSPSLRGSGFKSSAFSCDSCRHAGLPLYEGVDWNSSNKSHRFIILIVSLFTREWIEMVKSSGISTYIFVSLFTREWIEMVCIAGMNLLQKTVSLFTREWIEMEDWKPSRRAWGSPSLRGSGLKYLVHNHNEKATSVSLFTREWIEMVSNNNDNELVIVSLFTREWIEILTAKKRLTCYPVSLFTREWIEMQNRYCRYDDGQSPSLRGSGLK